MNRCSLVFLCLVVTGCSAAGSTSIPGSPLRRAANAVAREAVQYRELHSFSGGSDGERPYSGLVVLGTMLYGTTFEGGDAHCSEHGCGAIYSIGTSGAERVLHRFTGAPDGANPYAGMTAYHDTLYGTTYGGAASASGTIFKLKPSGTFHSLYGFPNDRGAILLKSGLTAWNDLLYGTTEDGGYGAGSVYSLGPATRNVSTLLAFTHVNGAYPSGNLTVLDGALYGTTIRGGTDSRGTIFEVRPSGTERVLFSFLFSKNSGVAADGVFPMGGVVAYHRVLYGTASKGGPAGKTWGTVFSFDPRTGSYRVLHAFDGTDGADPQSSLVVMDGKLYGTTSEGGGAHVKGTLFELDPSTGAFAVLHRFTGGDRGWAPEGNLVAYGHTLYGTTRDGGASGLGNVFALTP